MDICLLVVINEKVHSEGGLPAVDPVSRVRWRVGAASLIPATIAAGDQLAGSRFRKF